MVVSQPYLAKPLLPELKQLDNGRNTSRRFQPYSIQHHHRRHSHHHHQEEEENSTSMFNDTNEEDSLFGPVPEFRPILNNVSPPSTSPIMDDSCLILDDSEVFDEFDQFMDSSSPTQFLSSPPLSPILTPDDDDVDFVDFPLF